MRDKVIHDYFGVNLEIVWAVVQKELPKLRVAVEGLLPAGPLLSAAGPLSVHSDGLAEWLTFFHEPGGAMLSLISQVESRRPACGA
jgi:hypothetical protein